MGGKPVGIALLVFACAGCHACQSCYDYLPPVADSPYAVPGQRAGSAFGGPIDNGAFYDSVGHDGPLPDPAVDESEVLEEQTPAEDNHSA